MGGIGLVEEVVEVKEDQNQVSPTRKASRQLSYDKFDFIVLVDDFSNASEHDL